MNQHFYVRQGVSFRDMSDAQRESAFGMLRVLNYNGRGRVSLEQKPFVVSLIGESLALYEPPILQRPQ